MNTISNPYIGPRTFTEGERDRFYGRERESDELLARVLSEQEVVFYAQSGAGKSSLVNTHLIPDLREEGIQVLLGRVGGDIPAGLEVDNIFVFNLLRSLSMNEVNVDALSKLSISEFLVLGSDGDKSKRRALVIDQFEEIFSTHDEAWEKRGEFFKQLARALKADPRLRVVLVIREDFIASLDPYAKLMPGRFQARYYMQRLEYAAALKAVKEPVKGKEFSRPYAEGVAEKLVDDLRSVKVFRPGVGNVMEPGQYVEPVQLQVVCYNLWENLSKRKEDGQEITEEDLENVGDVNASLGSYYAARVEAVSRVTNVKERKIRAWFTEKLISPNGIRNMVTYDPRGESEGLENEVIHSLSDLVRAETRGGGVFYELTHDRLVEPILVNNKEWEDDHLNLLQLGAPLWDGRGRSDGLLLRGNELREAESWAKANSSELTAAENLYLEASLKLRAQAERDRRRNRLVKALAVSATIAMIVAILFFRSANESKLQAQAANTESALSLNMAQAASTQAIEMSVRAESYARLGLVHQLVDQSMGLLNTKYDLALLLNIEAYRLGIENPKTRGNLLANLNSPNLISILSLHNDAVRDLVFSPNGKILASGSSDKTIRLWDVSDPLHPAQLGYPSSGESSFRSLAFSPDGKTLASGGWKEIILWDVSDPQLPKVLGSPLTGHTNWVMSVAFSPDGKTLASGSDDNTIRLWDVSDPRVPKASGEPLSAHTEEVTSVAFSPDGLTLASGSWDTTIRLWDVSDPRLPKALGEPLSGYIDDVDSVTFSPDGKLLASGGWEKIILWDVSDPQQPKALGNPLAGHSSFVVSVAFSRDGKTLASGSYDKTIRLWDVSDPLLPEALGEPLSGHTDKVSSVAFSPDGKMLASGSWDTTIRLWDVSDPRLPEALGGPLIGNIDDLQSVAFSPDGKTLASGGRQEIILWDVTDPLLPVQLGNPLTGHTDWVMSVVFSPNNKLLASGSYDFAVRLWNLDTDDWLERTCAVIGRNLTRDEWAKYLPTEEYHLTCPQWPPGK